MRLDVHARVPLGHYIVLVLASALVAASCTSSSNAPAPVPTAPQATPAAPPTPPAPPPVARIPVPPVPAAPPPSFGYGLLPRTGPWGSMVTPSACTNSPYASGGASLGSYGEVAFACIGSSGRTWLRVRRAEGAPAANGVSLDTAGRDREGDGIPDFFVRTGGPSTLAGMSMFSAGMSGLGPTMRDQAGLVAMISHGPLLYTFVCSGTTTGTPMPCRAMLDSIRPPTSIPATGALVAP